MGQGSVTHGNCAKRHRNHVLAGTALALILGSALPLQAQTLGHATGGDGGSASGGLHGGVGGLPGQDGADGVGSDGSGGDGGAAPGGDGDAGVDGGSGGGGGGGGAHDGSPVAGSVSDMYGGDGGDGGDGLAAAGGGGGAGGDAAIIGDSSGNAEYVLGAGTIWQGGDGGAGGNGSGGGGGGGGGGAGLFVTGTNAAPSLSMEGTIAGGSGGGGGAIGGGGGGGAGVVVTDSATLTFRLDGFGLITGGNGGEGDGDGYGGDGVVTTSDSAVTATINEDAVIEGGDADGNGDGGAGLRLSGGGVIINAGTIRGGNGGGGSTGGLPGAAGGTGSGGAAGFVPYELARGEGTAGVIGADLSVINSGLIAGGTGYSGQTNAITFTGGTNRLELRDGFDFTGNVVVESGATGTLALGGDDNASFDVSTLTDAPSTEDGWFVGFDAFEKTGASVWTLTNETTEVTPWTLHEGTLSISSDAQLGDQDGSLTFSGGSLQTTATSTIERAIVLEAAGGTFTVAGVGTTTTLGGSITGTGGLTKTGTGDLILTAQSDYTGGTMVAEGILEVQADGALGTGPVRVDGGGAWTRLFFDGASAGDIELNIDDGLVFFRNGASAGSSTIVIDQDTSGATFVASTAGTSNITVHNGSLEFGSSSSAASATITNQDVIGFTDDASAGSATFENQRGGQLVFVDSSTVASATIVNRSGGLVGFIGKSTADGAMIVNEASGGIDLSGHSGHLGIGALSGNGDVYLGGNDLAIGALGNDGEIGGVIQDGGILGGTGGSLIKTGTGKLTLSGANTYTGGTSILGGSVEISEDANLGAASGGLSLNGGTLVTSAAMDSARSVTLAGTGAFDVASDTALGLSGTIEGAGDVLKRGEGTLVLTGTNAYEGDTLVEAGTLVANVASIRGSIGNGATLVLDQADDAAFAGDIGGLGGTNGQMVKQDAGTLTLDGVSTLDWTVSEGGLETEAARFGGNVQLDGAGTALSFADSDNAAYDGTISGNGHFSLDGEGTVLLTGDSAGFVGSTAINAGMLLVGDANGNGALGGSLHVLDGATIGGSGTIGSGAGSSVTVATGGSLSPGNSIGTLTVDGDLIFAAGSRLAVEVNPEGWESDLVAVTGTATLNGGAVAHIGANGNYDLRSTYTVLSAGELDGAFESVTSDFAFLNPDLIYDYDAGTVDLKLARNDIDFASTALTRNQIATAGGIESIGIVAGHSVYDAIAQLADDDDLIHASFDALSGEIHASAQTALIEDSRFVRNAANDRIRAAFATAAASYAPVLAYGPGDTPVLVSADHGGPVFWSHGFGSWGSTDSDANAAELDRSSGGLLIGADSLVGDWRVGLLAGYSHSSFDAQDRASSGASSNYHLGLYGGTEWGNLAFRTGAAYTWHDIETSRSVSIPGLTDNLSADYTAGTFQAFGELGYGLDLGTDTRLEPFVNLAHVNLHTNGSTEQGGAAALSVESGTTGVTFTTLGVRGEHNVALGTVDATLRGIIGWRHAFGDTTPESIHAFSAGDALTIAGAPIARNSAVIEAGLDLNLTPEATFGFSYQGQIASDAYDHGFKANLAVRF
ncbi:autotransporter domain-containing protein [Chelativorans sp. YIM 93263]|uniref:autotransporter domain-containing protein n=1 Tax=Chelativorans sp. YIM 93263 TaxID=2906648 RepID=UPI002379AA56|nr:autotransporter domain-containing protein [Chelativorans sp. YIM 93263]